MQKLILCILCIIIFSAWFAVQGICGSKLIFKKLKSQKQRLIEHWGGGALLGIFILK